MSREFSQGQDSLWDIMGYFKSLVLTLPTEQESDSVRCCIKHDLMKYLWSIRRGCTRRTWQPHVPFIGSHGGKCHFKSILNVVICLMWVLLSIPHGTVKHDHLVVFYLHSLTYTDSNQCGFFLWWNIKGRCSVGKLHTIEVNGDWGLTFKSKA